MTATNSPDFETPTWTLSGWNWGNVAVLLAFHCLMMWYFILTAPLLILFAIIVFIVNTVPEGVRDAAGLASLIVSPISITFLFWQIFGYIAPAHFGILRAVAAFTQRAHHLTPAKSLAIVWKRRIHTTKQPVGFIGWMKRMLGFRN